MGKTGVVIGAVVVFSLAVTAFLWPFPRTSVNETTVAVQDCPPPSAATTVVIQQKQAVSSAALTLELTPYTTTDLSVYSVLQIPASMGELHLVPAGKVAFKVIFTAPPHGSHPKKVSCSSGGVNTDTIAFGDFTTAPDPQLLRGQHVAYCIFDSVPTEPLTFGVGSSTVKVPLPVASATANLSAGEAKPGGIAVLESSVSSLIPRVLEPQLHAWVAWHLSLVEVSTVILYCTFKDIYDHLVKTLLPKFPKGVVIVLWPAEPPPISRAYAQSIAVQDAAIRFGEQFDGMVVVDQDEFLVLSPRVTLASLMEKHCNTVASCMLQRIRINSTPLEYMTCIDLLLISEFQNSSVTQQCNVFKAKWGKPLFNLKNARFPISNGEAAKTGKPNQASWSFISDNDAYLIHARVDLPLPGHRVGKGCNCVDALMKWGVAAKTIGKVSGVVTADEGNDPMELLLGKVAVTKKAKLAVAQ